MKWNSNEWQGRSERQVENNNKSQFIILFAAGAWVVCFAIFQAIKFLINYYE